jgi:hypothetical protein
MKAQVLTLPLDNEFGGFVTSELDSLMATHEVIEVRHELFFHDQAPWVMLYHLGLPAG